MMLYLQLDIGRPTAMDGLVKAAGKGDEELRKAFEDLKDLKAYEKWKDVWGRRVDACIELTFNGNYGL